MCGKVARNGDAREGFECRNQVRSVIRGFVFRKTLARPLGANLVERTRFPALRQASDLPIPCSRMISKKKRSQNTESSRLPDAPIVPHEKPASNMVITLIYSLIQ